MYLEEFLTHTGNCNYSKYKKLALSLLLSISRGLLPSSNGKMGEFITLSSLNSCSIFKLSEISSKDRQTLCRIHAKMIINASNNSPFSSAKLFSIIARVWESVFFEYL